MNQGLLGFPAGANQGKVTGIKRWWQYINGSVAVAGRTSRTYNVWYFNDTDEELIVSTQLSMANTGLEGYVASRPVDPTLLAYAAPMTQAVQEIVQCMGLNWGASDYAVNLMIVPPGYWYFFKVNGFPNIQNWNEYRRRP